MRRTHLFLALFFSGCGAPDAVVSARLSLRSPLVDRESVRSFELWIFDQVGRDGAPLLCDQLLTRQQTAASENVIVVGHTRGALGATIELDDLPVGRQNRVFYAEVFSEDHALGRRLGVGCVPSVSIVGAKRVNVDMTIDAPPPAFISE